MTLDLTATPLLPSLPSELAPALMADLPQGVFITNHLQQVVMANAALLSICGLSEAMLIGKPGDFFLHPLSNPQQHAAILAALAGEASFQGELCQQRPSGELYWAELHLTPLHTAAGEFSHCLGTLHDISIRKQIELELQASEQRYLDLIEHIPAGVVVHGAHSEILQANARACDLLGLSLEQMRGLEAIDPQWQFLNADGSRMALENYPVNQVLRDRLRVQNLVVGVKRNDATGLVWAMCNAFPVLDNHGLLSEVVVCFTEITELKRTEQALRKSEERLRLVLLGSNDAPWDWDLQSQTVYYAPRWWQMIGLAVEEQPSTIALWDSLLHPDDKQRVDTSLVRILGSSVQSFELEFRLLHKDGHYVPLLSRGFILRDEDGKPLRVSGTNTDLTERKLAEERIHQLAYYDALTELPNRRLLMEQLRKALLGCARNRRQGALLFIDLDNFKALNDTLGHDMGDQLLQQVAQRLRESVREVDTVARLGGDEFVVMLEDLSEEPQETALQAEMIGQKLLSELNRPYSLRERPYHSTPSIGIALFDQHTSGLEELLKQADVAMYQAKAEGRNTLRFFDPSMQASVDRRVALEQDLRDGLQRGELLIYCQPQVNAAEQVIGGEILVRWNSPSRGMVSPAEFIPLAEATGLILPLGEFVLRQACLQLASWACEPALAGITLAVNVSAQQMHEEFFVEQVLGILLETGANPQRLKLELTESLLAKNIDDIIAKMNRLRSHGISFSLDDFGTGYSSLSYLNRFPLEQLKIDQSFVRDAVIDPGNADIARVIIALADKLQLKVIAEGVETSEQHQFLLDNGCQLFQGYLFGRPMPMDEFTTRCRQA